MRNMKNGSHSTDRWGSIFKQTEQRVVCGWEQVKNCSCFALLLPLEKVSSCHNCLVEEFGLKFFFGFFFLLDVTQDLVQLTKRKKAERVDIFL